MTIQEATGHVGIGTTNPFGALHVCDDAGTGSAIISVEEETGHQYDLLSSSATHTRNPNGFSIYDRTVSQYRVLVNENGNVGIGTSAAGYKLQVGSSGDGSQARANAWYTFSDRRWKKDFEVIPDALAKLQQVNGYYYNWKEGTDTTQQVGVIAQEIEAILPQCVSTDENGYKSVDYSKLTAWLIQVNKEQEAEIMSLRTELNAEETSSQARLERIEAELGIGITSKK